MLSSLGSVIRHRGRPLHRSLTTTALRLALRRRLRLQYPLSHRIWSAAEQRQPGHSGTHWTARVPRRRPEFLVVEVQVYPRSLALRTDTEGIRGSAENVCAQERHCLDV